MQDNKSITSCHFSELGAFDRCSAAECALALPLQGSNENRSGICRQAGRTAIHGRNDSGHPERTCPVCVLEVFMSKASGILLIAVGVGVAAYAMPFDNQKGEPSTQQVSAGQVVKTDVATPVTSMTMTAPKALPEMEPPTAKPVVKPTPAESKS